MLRRTIFYAGYFPTLILVTLFICGPGWLFPFRLRMAIGTQWPRFISTFWLRLVTGTTINVTGLKNLPKTSFVALSNHQSEWETLYLAWIISPASIVLKKQLLKIPVYGLGLRGIRPIPIDRSSPKKAIRDILINGKERLQEGSNVLIFPEGTRLDTNTIGRYTRTGAKLAIEAQVPIVPMVHNAGKAWKRGGFFQKTQIDLIIGEPIYPPYDSNESVLTRDIENWAKSNLVK